MTDHRGTVGLIAANTFEYDSRHRLAADALAADGWRVVVVAQSGPGLPAEETLPSGAIVRRRALDGIAPTARGAVRRGLDALGSSRQVGRWAAATVEAAPEARLWLARSHEGVAAAKEAAKRSRGRYVYDIAETTAGRRSTALSGVVKNALGSNEANLIRGAAALLVSTPAMADEVARRFGVARPAVVMNARERWLPDRDLVRPTRLRRAIGIGGRRQVIIYQGAFRQDEGIQTLFDALAEPAIANRPVSAAFLGFGPLEDRLRAAAAAHPKRVSVLPPVHTELLLDWTAGADVAFVGTPPVNETQTLTTPNKVFEAAMAGVPVIVAGGTFTAQLVREHDLGDVVEPWTSRAVAQAIGRHLAAPAAERLARRRRIRAVALETLNWEVEREKLLAVFREL